MPKSDKGVVKRTIVTPDKHFPLHDQKAINCLKRAIEIDYEAAVTHNAVFFGSNF